MHLNIFQILTFALSFSCSLARNSHRSLLKRNPSLMKRADTKYVFMHHIVGNTNTYTSADWIDDIQKIQSNGVDALALNIGQNDWEAAQVANAYAAAKSLGTGFKLFISFDFTQIDCTLSAIVSQVNQYANHPNQFKVDGKPMISSYSGICLGNSGWESLKAQTNGYVMPFIPGLEGSFSQWPALDSWFCWGCGWPAGDTTINTNDDLYYLAQLGARYATTVSVWMFTHFSYKNWYQRGDDWLVNTRWEELFSLRDQLTFVEMVTWNDYGESDYFGSIKGAQPAGTTWATNFPHIAWFDMSQYYITAFKTGSYPAITSDVIYYWARPHPAAAVASNDPLPKPTGSEWAEDSMWAVAFATADATVILQCGSSSSTFSVTPGVNKLKIPLAPGTMTVKMIRNGQTIISETAQDYTYVLNPVLYNYNAWVGSATASVASSPTSTPKSSTSISKSSTLTPKSSTSTSKSSTSTSKSATSISKSSTTSKSATSTSTSKSATSTSKSSTSTSKSATSTSKSSTSTSKSATSTSTSTSKSSTSKSSISTSTSKSSSSTPMSLALNLESFDSTSESSSPTSKSSASTSTSTSKSSSPTFKSSASTSKSSSPISKSSRLTCPTKTTIVTAGNVLWNYQGCYQDDATRIMNHGPFDDTAQTVEKCLTRCHALGYLYAGVEYGDQCFCSNSVRKGAVKAAETECSRRCAGNAREKCGGNYRINVYKAKTTKSS